MKYKVPQLEPYFDEDELNNLKKVIETRWITEGPFSEEFLEDIKKFTKARYAVLASNGTLALYLSLAALDINESDEVILPDFTFSASASPVIFRGAVPKFVDVFDDDLNLDTGKIEQAITPKTKAIMPVHIYGRSCDMGTIMEIAGRHSIKVLEDAAQGFGVYCRGNHVGAIGDLGIISFFADKTITTGEGAVVLTNNEELYRRLLRGVKNVSFLKGNDFSNFVPFRVNIWAEKLAELVPFLESKGIQTRRLFYPLHRQPYLAHLGYKDEEFPVSNKAYDKGLSLPVFYSLKEEQIKYICGSIREFYEKG